MQLCKALYFDTAVLNFTAQQYEWTNLVSSTWNRYKILTVSKVKL